MLMELNSLELLNSKFFQILPKNILEKRNIAGSIYIMRIIVGWRQPYRASASKCKCYPRPYSFNT